MHSAEVKLGRFLGPIRDWCPRGEVINTNKELSVFRCLANIFYSLILPVQQEAISELYKLLTRTVSN